jgi:hypothetical protein
MRPKNKGRYHDEPGAAHAEFAAACGSDGHGMKATYNPRGLPGIPRVKIRNAKLRGFTKGADHIPAVRSFGKLNKP